MFILRISHISLILGSLVIYKGPSIAAHTSEMTLSDDLRSAPCLTRKPALEVELENTLKGTARAKLHETMDYLTYFASNRVARFSLGLLFPAAPFYCLELAAFAIAYVAPSDPFGLKPEVDTCVENTFRHPLISQSIKVLDRAKSMCTSFATNLWTVTRNYLGPVEREVKTFGGYLYNKWTSWG